jgi:hypothetical protein
MVMCCNCIGLAYKVALALGKTLMYHLISSPVLTWNVALGTLVTAADLSDKFHPAAENTHVQLNPSIPCSGRPSICSDDKFHPIKVEKTHISGNFHQVDNFF